MKAKSQAAGWKGMLIKHGEKGVLGLIAAVVCWMMFSGLQQQGLKPDKSPTNLADRVENAEKYISTSFKMPQVNGGEKFKDNDYNTILKDGFKDLKFDDQVYNIEPGIFSPIAKRTQPIVYPAEDVQVTALVVQVAIADEKAVKQQESMLQDLNNKKLLEEMKKKAAEEKKRQADEQRNRLKQAAKQPREGKGRGPNALEPQPAFPTLEQQGVPVVARPQHPAIQNVMKVTSITKPIAVVTALIPYRKQIHEFNQTLVEGKDIIAGRLPDSDSPKIATFVVERARVVNPKEPNEKLEWVDITEDEQKFFLKLGKQLTRSEEPVVPSLLGPNTKGIPKKNIAPWQTICPLPTLADRKWQREVTHPRIPLFTDLNEDQLKQEETNAFLPPPAVGFQPTVPVEQVEVELPEYVLFRFIDFNVFPGQNYRYRVTLQYQNPNAGLDSKYLGSEVNMAEELVTAASTPSESISLPPLHLILAGGDVSYPPPKRYDAVPSSRIWQWLIDVKRGGEVAKQFPESPVSGLAVGDLLEFTATVKNILNRAAGQPEELVDYAFSKNKILPPGSQMPYLVDVFGKQAPPPPRPPAPRPGVDGTIPPPVVEPPREQPYSEILYVDESGKLRSSSSTYADTQIHNYKLRYEVIDPSMTNSVPGSMSSEPGRGSGNPLFDTERPR